MRIERREGWISRFRSSERIQGEYGECEKEGGKDGLVDLGVKRGYKENMENANRKDGYRDLGVQRGYKENMENANRKEGRRDL